MINPNLGESKAASYLKKHGIKILCRNYSCKLGEIDIVAYDKGVTAFVEVKQRKTDAFGRPMDFVTKQKQERIKRAAKSYVQKYKPDGIYRFDVIEVLGDEINYIKNAFC